ncbi:hypothetical protein [Nakamurella multipartita]|uniref:hypothetical protein n=1 Tax=Nakamurella multipartita TaxID=53461 RepID=UPI00019E8741|nr:hypothetical protein [Nakamurella multipartita]
MAITTHTRAPWASAIHVSTVAGAGNRSRDTYVKLIADTADDEETDNKSKSAELEAAKARHVLYRPNLQLLTGIAEFEAAVLAV